MSKDAPIFKIKAIHDGKEVEKCLLRGTDLRSMTDEELDQFLSVVIEKLEKAD